MKSTLAGIGSGLATLSFLAAIPVFIATIGAMGAGLATLAVLGYRTYRRMGSRAH